MERMRQEAALAPRREEESRVVLKPKGEPPRFEFVLSYFPRSSQKVLPLYYGRRLEVPTSSFSFSFLRWHM